MSQYFILKHVHINSYLLFDVKSQSLQLITVFKNVNDLKDMHEIHNQR